MDLITFSHNIIKNNFTTQKYNDLLSYFGLLQLNNFRIKKIIKKNINLKSILGGGNGLEEFVLNDDNKYIARLIHGDSTDIKSKTHTIKFISVDDINEKSLMCAILNFDYEQKTAYIQSIGDYDNCLLCANRKHEYKMGQILMIIIINICLDKKPKIKYIELKDNSTLQCMKTYKETTEWKNTYQQHNSLLLRIIRTLTSGEPYYCKYGFMPKNDDDIDVYEHNKKIFNKDQLLNTIDIEKLILRKITDEKHIKIYKKYILPIIHENNNKPVKYFIKKLFDINSDPYTKSVICFIIEKIYIKIFDLLGYKRYLEAVFIKKI